MAEWPALRPLTRLAVATCFVAGCSGPSPSGSAQSETPGPTNAATSAASADPSPSVTPSGAPSASPIPSGTPEPEPTDGPAQTPEGAFPLRTEVEVHAGHDRAGVPADVRGMYWWTYYSDAGSIGSTAQIGLPGTEKVLTVAEGIVVSARNHPGRFGDSEALMIRDFASGALIREIPVAMDWPDAEVIDGQVFWTGMTWDQGEDEETADAGVWTVRVDRNDEPEAIVEPGKIIGSPLSGRRLELSPSRRTMAAITTAMGGREWTDFIDVGSRSRIARHDVSIDTLTDEAYVIDEQETTDAPNGGHPVTVRDIVTGSLRWRFPDPSDEKHFAPNDMHAFGGIVVIDYSWRTDGNTEKVLAAFDLSTGSRHVLLRQDWSDGDPLSADFSVSTSDHLLLPPEYRIGYSIGRRDVPVAVLNVATGDLEPRAFVIDPPWFCEDEYCFRD